MNERLNKLFHDKLIIIVNRIYLFILFLFCIIIIWKWSVLPPELPLFYSFPKGSEQLGNPFQLLLLPFFSVIIYLINALLASFFYTKEKLFSQMLMITSLISSLFLLITFIKIIFLIT